MKGGDILSYDYRKLRGKIKEVCGTQDAFSEKLGIGRVSLSQRLNNQLEFSWNSNGGFTVIFFYYKCLEN